MNHTLKQYSIKLLAAAILLAQHGLASAQDDITIADDDLQSATRPAPSAGNPDIEEIVTLGKYIPDEKRSTAAISNVIDTEAFVRAGDANVAEGLKRVSGINLQGGKFVYIRGLGERYSSTILNGSTLPSPEPINRVVPLDMFPANVIESVMVQKTFSAQYPAEFAGGTIQMRTKVVPDESFFSVSSSMGYAGNTTGESGLVYDGGNKDWMGKDDGTRDLPDLLKSAISGNRELRPNSFVYQNGFEPAELEAIGESLDNNYTAREKTIQPDYSTAANFGTALYVDDFRFGILGNLSHSSSWDTIDVSRNSYASTESGTVEPSDIMQFRSTEQSVDNSLFLTAGVEYAQAHTLKATVLQIHKMDDLTGRQQGRMASEDILIDQTRLEFVEQGLLSQQLQGEHVFDVPSELTIEWHYNQSRAKRESPDTRQYRYDYDPRTDDYQFSLRGDANSRIWADLEDNNDDMGINAKLFLQTPFDTSTQLSFGATAIEREREAYARRFRFVGQGSLLAGDPGLLYRPTLDEIINADTIDPDGFILRENTQPTDNYVANQNLDAWYVEADMELSYRFRLLAGVRSETSEQVVQTFNLFRPDELVEANLDSDDLFPVLTATYILDEYDMQLRAGYSETISRPDFRELSPAFFVHPVTGFTIVGNPDLTVAYIKNYDTRWEWYFSGDESVSVGLFYKEFDSPIEAVIRPGPMQERSFINAQDATTYGIEFDGYRWLDFVDERLENFYVASNLTLIESEVNIRPQDRGTLTNTTRPLQGQADFIANIQLGYDNGFNQKASFVYHVTGEKIREVGILGAPDVVDEVYGELDFTYTRYWGESLEMTMKAKNLLNQKRETTQGGFDVNSWYEGTNASLGLTWNF